MRALALISWLCIAGVATAAELPHERGVPDPCDATAWRTRVAATEKAVVESAPFRVPAAVWRGSVRQACAVVVFTVDADGRAVAPELLAYSPNAVAGKAALETLSRYRFKAPSDGQHTLRFQLWRFGPERD